jgi:hypothetical protein
MSALALVDESGKVVVDRLEVADGFWSRMVGLQLRRALAPRSALLLIPCGSIHTCFMRFAIDMVCLDGGGRVLAVKTGVRPWRVAFAPRGTHAVLETAAGGASGLRPGGRLRLAGSGPAALRPALSFLAEANDPSCRPGP